MSNPVIGLSKSKLELFEEYTKFRDTAQVRVHILLSELNKDGYHRCYFTYDQLTIFTDSKISNKTFRRLYFKKAVYLTIFRDSLTGKVFLQRNGHRYQLDDLYIFLLRVGLDAKKFSQRRKSK